MGHQIISPAMHCRPGQKPGRLLRLSQPFARKTANLKRFSAYIQIFAYDPSQFGHNNRLSFYSESKRAVFGPIKECLICPIICTTKLRQRLYPGKRQPSSRGSSLRSAAGERRIPLQLRLSACGWFSLSGASRLSPSAQSEEKIRNAQGSQGHCRRACLSAHRRCRRRRRRLSHVRRSEQQRCF